MSGKGGRTGQAEGKGDGAMTEQCPKCGSWNTWEWHTEDPTSGGLDYFICKDCGHEIANGEVVTQGIKKGAENDT